MTLIQENQTYKTTIHATLRHNDEQILQTYSLKECEFIVKEHFHYLSPSMVELGFPIAFAISVYKSA